MITHWTSKFVASTFSARKQFPRILQKPNLHYTPVASNQRQVKPVPKYLFKAHFNIIRLLNAQFFHMVSLPLVF